MPAGSPSGSPSPPPARCIALVMILAAVVLGAPGDAATQFGMVTVMIVEER
jgi:hypothetical protein